MTEDDILSAWAKLKADVEVTAKLCERDPQSAIDLRITPPKLRLNGQENVHAAWLEAIAKAMIPPTWRWQVVQFIGGGAELYLQAYDPDPAPT